MAQAAKDTGGCYDMTFLLTGNLENIGEFEGIAVGLKDEYDNDITFTGVFDGGGHTISDMVIRSDAHDVGFIGALEGTVKNLTLEDCFVINDNDSIYSNTGMIAGFANNGTIINCLVFDGIVEGVWAGAIVGTEYVRWDSENNYYDTRVSVLRDGIKGIPGHCGTGEDDISYNDAASVIWTVTFVDEDGVTELAEPQLVKDGEHAEFPTLLQEPAARDHFTVDMTRWRKTNGSEHSFDFEYEEITGDVELTPMWIEEESYLVSFAAGEGGTGEMASVRVYVSDAAHYILPRCFFTAPAGMAFDKWLYNGEEIAVGSEISFEGNITLTAQWSRPEYSVQIDDEAHGEVTADPETAHAQDMVTLTAVPDEGYKLDELHVLNSAGQEIEVTNENSAWHFTMPAEDVIVKAVFFPSAFGTPNFTMPENLTTIEESAFEGMTQMTIVDASHCTGISAYAFRDTGLTQIRLLGTCEINDTAFYGLDLVYVFAPAGGKAETFCNTHDNAVLVSNGQAFMETITGEGTTYHFPA